MNKLSLVYQKKKAFSKFYCDEVIRYFESSDKGIGNSAEDGISKVNRSVKNSLDTSFSLYTPFNPLWVTMAQVLDKSLREMCGIYRGLGQDYGIGWAPDKETNIQKYYPTQGYTVEHCEHSPQDPYNRRLLAWMLYLNDVTDKGGTHFSNQGITLKARTGDLYIWPAYYTHMHYGVPSPTQIKYIVTGWCSFNIVK